MPDASSKNISRRAFLARAAAVLAAGAAGAAVPVSALTALGGGKQASGLPAKPNMLFLVTDQERQPRHWPEGWADANLNKARKKLLDNGLEFTRAYCNSSMCSPSRCSLFTGLYPAQHGVTHTLTEGGSLSPSEVTLSPSLLNLARLLGEAGYDVQYRGKWHLSKGADGGTPTADDVAAFGFNGWTPTDAGEAQDVDNFGGGCAAHDDDTIAQAIAYLQTQTPEATATKPFCLVVCLANPHDVLAYPRLWNQETCEDSYKNTADLDLGLTVPASYASDDLSLKPGVQQQSKDLYALGLGTLPTPGDRLDYVNFYGYLHKVVDEKLDSVLQVLADRGLTAGTVVVRTADHGEMGLAHSRLRQKMFNVYEESYNVPLIISNPALFPSPATTTAYAGLVDVLPTVAALCGVPSWKWRHLPGKDLGAVLQNPTASVQDTILVTFDDEYAGQNEAPPYITEPCHIRCLIHRDADGEWKYARYFDPEGSVAEIQEMYRLRDGSGADADPDELDNMANPASPNYNAFAAKRQELAALLTAQEASRLAPAVPGGPPLPYLLLLGEEEV